MANQGYKPPGFLPIVGGVILFIVLLGLACSISTTVKAIGYGLLYVPSKLGWVEVPGPESIRRLDLVSTPVLARFDKPGTYEVFTSSYELLSISLQLEASSTTSWFHVVSVDTGKPSQIYNVTRGLMPFDSPFAEGRPVLRVSIDEPGMYRLSFPTPPAARVYFVPDTTTGKEWLIWLIYLGEVGLIVGVPGWFYIRSWRSEAEDLAAMRSAWRVRADSFWEEEQARNEQDTRGESHRDV
jgi:hypothetical protein